MISAPTLPHAPCHKSPQSPYSIPRKDPLQLACQHLPTSGASSEEPSEKPA